MTSNPVVIVDAVRTPIGRFCGSLAPVRADHLGAVVLNALMERNGLSPDVVDDVVFGCVTQIGEQSANIARTSLLGAGWPETIPGMTVDRKCGSSEAAVHVARSEEHTSELQSLMRNSYAVFFLKKKNKNN